MALVELRYKCRVHGWLNKDDLKVINFIEYRCSHEGCDLPAIGFPFPVKDQEVARA